MSGFFVPHDLKAPLKGAAGGPQVHRTLDVLRESTLDVTGLEPGRHSVRVMSREFDANLSPVKQATAEVLLTRGTTELTLTLRPR